MVAAAAGRFAWQKLGPQIAGLLGWQKGAGMAKNLTNAGLRYIPEAAYAGMSGTIFAPENATFGERVALAGEDLGIGLLSSIGGQAAGRGIARATAKKGINAQQMADRLDFGSTAGDIAGGVGMVMLPRPVTQGVYEAAGERANQTQEQVAAAQQDALEQEMLAAAALLGLQGGFSAGVAAPRSVTGSAMNLTS